jgi:hypothetical protein
MLHEMPAMGTHGRRRDGRAGSTVIHLGLSFQQHLPQRVVFGGGPGDL